MELETINLGTFLVGMEPQLKILEDAEVDLDAFLLLNDHDLAELGFNIGARKKLLNIAQQIKATLNGGNIENSMDFESGSDYDEDEDEDEEDEEEEEEEEEVEEGEQKQKQEHVKQQEQDINQNLQKLQIINESKKEEEGDNKLTITILKSGSQASVLTQQQQQSPTTPTTPSPSSIKKKKSKGTQKHRSSKLEVPNIRADEIEGTSLQGWIRKLGSVINRWSKVWCVVKGPCLYYFTGPSELAKGMITLPSYTISPNPSLHPFAFTLVHPSAPSYSFTAHNQQDMMQWVSTLQLSSLLTPTATLSPIVIYFFLFSFLIFSYFQILFLKNKINK